MSIQKQPRQSGGSYQMSAQPDVIKTKEKQRDPFYEDPDPKPQNIMWDRRIVRGNTYAAMIIPNVEQTTQNEIPKNSGNKIQNVKREGTPDPVDGRKHISIDCIGGDDTILKPLELQDKPPDRAIDVQTDFYIDRPPTPKFIPSKNGHDIQTQIIDGDLFDFDVEVEPILQVIVGKTLEQSRMEVLEEEELEAMKTHQKEFERIRDTYLIEAQRLEEEEKRREDEIRRRVQELSIVYEQKKFSHQKYSCRIISKAYLHRLKNKTFDHLKTLGFLKDTSSIVVRGKVDHQLTDKTIEEYNFYNTVKSFLDSFVTDTYENLEIKGNEGVNVYKSKRTKHYDMIQHEKKLKEEESERRRLERLRKEIERIRKIKRHNIDKVLSTEEVKDIESVQIRDINDKDSGLYTIGGSFTELLLSLLAYDEYQRKERNDFELTKELILNLLKSVCPHIKSKIQLPKLNRSVINDLGDVHTKLPELFEDEANADECKGILNKIVNALIKTESFKLLIETSSELGIDQELIKKTVYNILESFFKDRDLLDSLAKLEGGDDDNRSILAQVILKKPLNRNVWEQDNDFMNNNNLDMPSSDEEKENIIELYIQQRGKNAFKESSGENNVKIINKNIINDRYVFIHTSHIDNMRDTMVNKLISDLDEFNDLFNKYIVSLKEKQEEKYVSQDNIFEIEYW